MTDFFPDGIVWLTENDLYHAGAEMGAMCMLMQFGAPLILARIKARNEEQLRALAPSFRYRLEVLTRTNQRVDIRLDQPDMLKEASIGG